MVALNQEHFVGISLYEPLPLSWGHRRLEGKKDWSEARLQKGNGDIKGSNARRFVITCMP